jgi:hypothetical protein
MSLSISLQLEAGGYPGLNSLITKSGISRSLRDKKPDKHMTLAIINVPVEDVIYDLKASLKKQQGGTGKSIALSKLLHDPDKLTRRDVDLIEGVMESYFDTITTKFALKEIKPLVDKLGGIELEFSDLDLWDTGHFVAVFHDDFEGGWDDIVGKTRRFLRRTFPTGSVRMREDEIVPHLTLAKYDTDRQMELKRKLKQPDWNVPDYKIIEKRWRIYPSVRYYD